jgi:hypothetical protein
MLSDNPRTQTLIGWANDTGDADLRAEIKMTEKPGKAGLVFGARDDASEFFLLEVQHCDAATVFYVRHCREGAFELLTEQRCTLPPTCARASCRSRSKSAATRSWRRSPAPPHSAPERPDRSQA